MTAAPLSSSGSAAPSMAFEDYSLYSNLSDDELLQLAVERSLTDLHCNTANTNTVAATTPPHPSDSTRLNPAARDHNQPRHSSHSPPPAEAAAHYSSPNPPSEKPPDPYVSFYFAQV